MKNKKPIHKELLSKRVFFRNDNARDKLFAKLKTQFGTWRALRAYLNIHKVKLERIRNGEVSIKYPTFLHLLSKLNDEERGIIQQQITLNEEGWGRSKGGIATYHRHKEFFEKGRKIAAIRARDRGYRFNFNTLLTPNFCELIGAFIGDGFTNKYDRLCVVQFTGHSKLDKEYFLKTLRPIVKELTPDSNPAITEIDNTLRLTIYSKQFHNLLTKRFKFPAGKKTHTVTMPEEIIKSGNQDLINRCIRGIFDTDGCVFTDKRKAYKLPYMRIALGMKSKELIKQVNELLLRQGIASTMTKNLDKLQINGAENCRKFVEKIGFSNRRHLDKIKFKAQH